MLLFAYAGNMDVDNFSAIVPSARKIGVASLPGYNFIFNKTAGDQSSKANIIPSADADAVVWGVLIQLDDNEKPSFYNPDSWSRDLKLEPVSCVGEDGEIYQAEAFVALPHAVNTFLLPYDWYHQKILQLAKIVKLPAAYINKLSFMNFKIDPDTERRARRLKNLKIKVAG